MIGTRSTFLDLRCMKVRRWSSEESERVRSLESILSIFLPLFQLKMFCMLNNSYITTKHMSTVR